MCGIVGYLSSLDPALLVTANRLQAHRGPDSEDVWADPDAGISLGHTRLSIIDLSPAGAQPMASRDGTVVPAFNGEIYNFRELRKELEGALITSDYPTAAGTYCC